MTPSSLSVVNNSSAQATRVGKPGSGSDGASASGGTTEAGSSSSTTKHDVSLSTLDFIGSSVSVKDLFSLPYAVDRPISVAVHNLGGTLLVDVDPDHCEEEDELTTRASPSSHCNPSKRNKNQSTTSSPSTASSGKTTRVDSTDNSSLPENERDKHSVQGQPEESSLSRSLVALSGLESSPSSEALTIVNSLIQSSRSPASNSGAVRTTVTSAHRLGDASSSKFVEMAEKPPVSSLGIPSPEDYVGRFIPLVPEPRQYLSWKFHDMSLLVGSNALIYRSTAATDDTTTTTSPSSSTALTIRLEEAGDLQKLADQHREMVRSGDFIADHQYAKLQQMGKPSYADATRTSANEQQKQAPAHYDDAATDNVVNGGSSSFAAPNLDQVRLQTCIVPVPSAPVGALLSAQMTSEREVLRLGAHSDIPTDPVARSPSPVSTVLDTYLDNIMANVPQLALCLQEKGFVRSIKLLNTEQIPSSLLHPSTTDTSVPFEVVDGGEPADRVFSPEIMEMNAATLLRFIRTQCTKDNSTYLLRREAGCTNIQLYDITSISSKQQQTWNWLLARISYRFASRLRSLAANTPAGDGALSRGFRARQRSLLQNTLELLSELSDLNGNAHESLVAAINEDLADSFLTNVDEEAVSDNKGTNTGNNKMPSAAAAAPPTFVVSQQPYSSVTVDALGKAQDYFTEGIRVLWPTLERSVGTSSAKKRAPRRKKVVVVSVNSEDDSSGGESGDDEQGGARGSQSDVGPVATQLFGLHHKLVSVSLRLAEIHLGNYYSSSAMQALRTAARRLSDSLFLIKVMKKDEDEESVDEEWKRQIKLQYTWLWEHCGHFARSFSTTLQDNLWRERGHASGEDVISLLQDVDCALRDLKGLDGSIRGPLSFVSDPQDRLSEESRGSINLHSLSGVVGHRSSSSCNPQNAFSNSAVVAAEEVLGRQGLLKREQRRVLVAACIAYGRSIDSYRRTVASSEVRMAEQPALLGLLQQRLGDACNETGKIMMNEVRLLLATLPSDASEDRGPSLAAEPLLCSAEFWFSEGLAVFEACKDLRNLALLRCNLCQCWKLRANSVFVKDDASKHADGATHAETCLQQAANQLQSAHEALGQRDRDALTWDMVSGELAATFLVLGVRRRQSLLGTGNVPVILHALRLNPGKERSIVDPMERALAIYEQSGNQHQAAATHYQLALFYSKIWTCQRDENKTREKLAAAFQHYTAAHTFFSQSVRGNEPTFCVLCLDLSNLYSSVSGEEFHTKALLRCLDTASAFGRQRIEEVARDLSRRSEWFQKMDTLAGSVEERVFKILRNLVKMEETSERDYKELYRVGLHAKMAPKTTLPTFGDEAIDATANRLLALQDIIEALRDHFDGKSEQL